MDQDDPETFYKRKNTAKKLKTQIACLYLDPKSQSSLIAVGEESSSKEASQTMMNIREFLGTNLIGTGATVGLLAKICVKFRVHSSCPNFLQTVYGFARYIY